MSPHLDTVKTDFMNELVEISSTGLTELGVDSLIRMSHYVEIPKYYPSPLIIIHYLAKILPQCTFFWNRMRSVYIIVLPCNPFHCPIVIRKCLLLITSVTLKRLSSQMLNIPPDLPVESIAAWPKLLESQHPPTSMSSEFVI